MKRMPARIRPDLRAYQLKRCRVVVDHANYLVRVRIAVRHWVLNRPSHGARGLRTGRDKALSSYRPGSGKPVSIFWPVHLQKIASWQDGFNLTDESMIRP